VPCWEVHVVTDMTEDPMPLNHNAPCCSMKCNVLDILGIESSKCVCQ
jgi:hypothetical protein